MKLYPVKTNGYTLYEIQTYLTFPWLCIIQITCWLLKVLPDYYDYENDKTEKLPYSSRHKTQYFTCKQTCVIIQTLQHTIYFCNISTKWCYLQQQKIITDDKFDWYSLQIMHSEWCSIPQTKDMLWGTRCAVNGVTMFNTKDRLKDKWCKWSGATSLKMFIADFFPFP